MEEHKTKKYFSKRQRENSVLFNLPSSSPSLLFTVKCLGFSQWNGNSLPEAPPVEPVGTVLPGLRTSGEVQLCWRQQPVFQGLSHLSPSCPTPGYRLLWLLGLTHGLSSVMYWLQITISLTTAGKGREGTEHRTFVSWLRTEKRLPPYTTSDKLCLFLYLSYSPQPALNSIVVNTLIFMGVKGRREWWCCSTKGSLYRWIRLLSSILLWFSDRCRRTPVFLFPDESPRKPIILSVAIYDGNLLHFSTTGTHQSFIPLSHFHCQPFTYHAKWESSRKSFEQLQ